MQGLLLPHIMPDYHISLESSTNFIYKGKIHGSQFVLLHPYRVRIIDPGMPPNALYASTSPASPGGLVWPYCLSLLSPAENFSAAS